MIKIIREIYFVNDLRINMLINMNIQIVEKIIIDISQRKFILFNCSKFFIFIDVFVEFYNHYFDQNWLKQ